jgi:hypothetical protein
VSARRRLLLGLAAAGLWGAGAAAAQDCSAASLCQENPRFSVTLTDFRVVQGSSANRPLAATLRLRNKTDAPLTLVCVDRSAAALDDQGQRNTLDSRRKTDVQGIPVSTRDRASSQLTLAPGGARRAQFR